MKKKMIKIAVLCIALMVGLSASAVGLTAQVIDESAYGVIEKAGRTTVYFPLDPRAGKNGKLLVKEYTEEELSEAENALKNCLETVYLDASSPIYKAIAEKDGMRREIVLDILPNGPEETADAEFFMDRIMPMYISSLEAIAESKGITFTDNENLNLTGLMKNSDTGEFCGHMNASWDGGKLTPGGYGVYLSPYVLEDFFTHRVEIHETLQNSPLDLANTTAKFVSMTDSGWMFFFEDGKHEYLLQFGDHAGGMLYREYDSAEWKDRIYDDPTSHFRLISVKDFVAMAEEWVWLENYYFDKYLAHLEPHELPMGGNIVEVGRSYDRQYGNEPPVYVPRNSADSAAWWIAGGALGVAVIVAALVLTARRRKAQGE